MDERATATQSTEAGVVAAAVYHGGRKIADIEIDEAGEWTKREGHVVWIGLYEPSHELLARVRTVRAASPRDRGRESGASESEARSSMAMRCSSSRAPRRWWKAASLSARRISSSATAMSYRCATARRPPTRGQAALRGVPGDSVARRGLSSSTLSRFHRRQLRAGHRGHSHGGRHHRGPRRRRRADQRRGRAGSIRCAAIS